MRNNNHGVAKHANGDLHAAKKPMESSEQWERSEASGRTRLPSDSDIKPQTDLLVHS